MSMRTLPPFPSLDHLRKEAKSVLRTLRAETPTARLADAQFRLARAYGFASWTKLKRHVDDREDDDLTPVLRALRDGRPVILFDDTGKENEGDFVVAGEHVTTEIVNFVTKHGRGTLCLALSPEQVDRLGLPLVRPSDDDPALPAFTASIDARDGVTTGVSAADRARTIRVASAVDATPASVRSPGHVFPLRAVPNGIRGRQGHTEASLELMRRAGLVPAAAICEILNDDGSMARLPDVERLARELRLEVVTISRLLT